MSGSMSRSSDTAAAEVFSALGDETRLAVMARLGAGKLSATSLSSGARMTRQAIVKHLQVLEGAGLVTHEKRGREVLYAVEGRRIEEARAFLETMSARWDRAIDRLREMVEEQPPRKGSKTGRR
jgi:DNA-binding transcriptional ArsR family regulator